MMLRTPGKTTTDVELIGRRRPASVPVGHPVRTGAVASLIAVIAIVAIVAGGIPGGPQFRFPWQSSETLHVHLTDSRALQPHASVEVAGIKVGEVVSVTGDQSGADATIVIDDPSQAALRTDATVYLRPHGLFGPKYLDIQPGTAKSALGDGASIDPQHTVQPVDLDDVLAALQAPEQANLRTALVELGAASEDRGSDVNKLLVSADSLTSNLEPALAAVSADSSNLNDLIIKNEQFNSTFQTTPLDQLVANNNTVLAAIAANSDHLQSLFVHANSSLATLTTTLNGETGNGRAILDALPKTIDDLDTFNANLALFARNLTGKDTTAAGDTDVTSGIIAAIENPKSAFSSYDCTVSTSPCPTADRDYYLRVQIFNLAGSGAASTLNLPICGLPIYGAVGKPTVVCPSGTTAAAPAGSQAAPSDVGSLAAFISG